MHFHFCGVAGIGMANLARLVLMAGHTLTGSDCRKSPIQDELLKAGAQRVSPFQHGDNVCGADVVVKSVAVPDKNPEIGASRVLGIPVWTKTQCLSWLIQNKATIAIAGSFGKSSTTTLLADILVGAEMDPTIYVGGNVPTLGCGARWGQGDISVVEACEYQREIQYLFPKHLVITNLAVNHEDVFGYTLNGITDFFERYISSQEYNLETIWLNESDPGSRIILSKGIKHVQKYGTVSSEWSTVVHRSDSQGSVFELFYRGQSEGYYKTHWPGLHVVANLTPVLGLARYLDLKPSSIAIGLKTSKPLDRRYQIVYKDDCLEIIDDNARLPEQVATTVNAARLMPGYSHIILVVLGIWGRLNRRNLQKYALGLQGCEHIFVLPSEPFDVRNGGPEPEGADEELVSLLRGQGASASCMKTTDEINEWITEFPTRILMMGYDSFNSKFEEVISSVRHTRTRRTKYRLASDGDP